MSVLVLAPLGLEARAVRRGAGDLQVMRVGPGPRRARRAAARLPAEPPAIAVVGLAGALTDGPAPGDLVVASEVRSPGGEVFSCPRAGWLARELGGEGAGVWLGPLVSHPQLAVAGARRRLARSGALAVDMETAWLAAGLGAGAQPLAAVRAIVDTPSAELLRPGTAWRARRALRALGQVGPALRGWGELVASSADDWPAAASGPDTAGREPRTMGGVS
ncbi:MAG: hypothetical protein E6G56_07135 [Actinobacteria bacterium]|nr:MAG: hypothetical protein E6G56_07135 [Actinomycetota bacterium]